MTRTLEQQLDAIVISQIFLIGERTRLISIRDNPAANMDAQVYAGASVVDMDRLMCDNNIRFAELSR